MKNFNLFTFLIALGINFLAGLVFTAYSSVNMILCSVVLLCNFILLYLLKKAEVRSAFKYSLFLCFGFFEFAGVILAVLSPSTWEDNGYLLVIVLLIALQFILYMASKIVSSLVK